MKLLAHHNTDECRRLRPAFLIVGAQKGGTTALYEYLSAHPDVAPPSKKETNFFLCQSLYLRGPTFYHEHFPEVSTCSPQTVTFEASPNYLISAEAAQRIRAYDATMRLIALLRDPVTRAHSAWQMYRRFYRRDRDWFIAWVSRCDDSLGCSSYIARAQFGESFEYDIEEEIQLRQSDQKVEMPILRHGLYHDQLQAYLNYFPQQQMFIQSSEYFLTETNSAIKAIAKFVELKPDCWASSRLSPVFVGDYPRTISSRAVDLLKDFYRKENQRLFSLIGEQFNWL